MAVIADASVAVKWVVGEELRDHALDVLEKNDVVVPDLLLAEVRNALVMRVRRNLSSSDEARMSEAEFALLPLIVVPTKERLARAFELALALKHPVYDCVYLALAAERELPLVTADRRMSELARQIPGLEGRITLLGDIA